MSEEVIAPADAEPEKSFFFDYSLSFPILLQ